MLFFYSNEGPPKIAYYANLTKFVLYAFFCLIAEMDLWFQSLLFYLFLVSLATCLSFLLPFHVHFLFLLKDFFTKITMQL